MSDVFVRLPADIAQKLDALAADERRSRANAAQWLIAEGLSRRVDGDWIKLSTADGTEVAAVNVIEPSEVD